MIRNIYATARIWLSQPALDNDKQRVPRLTAHDKRWGAHPTVATGDDLTLGQRAADRMKSVFATWTALFSILAFMALWIRTGGFGHDAFPFILLNLCLSCLAALQCFILLIAAKRSDEIDAAVARNTLDNTQDIKTLIEANTALTEQVAQLTRAVHDALTTTTTAQASKE